MECGGDAVCLVHAAPSSLHSEDPRTGYPVENSLLLHLPGSPLSHPCDIALIASRDPTRQLKKKLPKWKTLHTQGPEVSGAARMQ